MRKWVENFAFAVIYVGIYVAIMCLVLVLMPFLLVFANKKAELIRRLDSCEPQEPKLRPYEPSIN